MLLAEPAKITKYRALRPFNGRSTTLRSSMTCDTEVAWVCTMLALAADLNLLGDLSHLKCNVDGGILIDLKYDSGLDIGLETANSHFQRIGSNRQVREQVAAICGTYRRANKGRLGLRS